MQNLSEGGEILHVAGNQVRHAFPGFSLLICRSDYPIGEGMPEADRKTVGSHTPPLFLAYFSGCWANSSRQDWEQK